MICASFVMYLWLFTLKSLLSHIDFEHSRSPDFRLACGIDGCTKEYRVYNSFWYHNGDLLSDVLSRHGTAIVMNAREKHNLSQVPTLAEATELVNADHLVDFTPYYSHTDNTYVPMKYYLGDVIELHKASNV